MSKKSEFVTLAKAVVDGRLYPQTAPENTRLPYATWAQVGGPSLTFLEGANASKDGARVQINVWAKDDIEADAVMIEMSDVIVALPICGDPQGSAQMTHSQPPNMRGMKRDFIIWFDKP
ncbi:MAG TPA: DUF3168 domain-containing protein [Methylophilus sp.]|uniref:tail completion protein gp17 n=1 Tax=Methylophilus sp. TaxID=29541 RepID=UPI002C768EB5|nr:DUF3168 domain-containing protein [Methylophilus sp.]HSH86889.1 DUF3168 domain-containing protein [Methylophilus sp.]